MARLSGILLFYCLFGGYFPLLAQEGVFSRSDGRPVADPAAPEHFQWCVDLFEEQPALTMELSADFTELEAQKEDDRYRPATLTLFLDAKRLVRMNVRIRPRGYSRLKACAIPPVKIDFSHKGTKLDAIRALDELKAVTLCRLGEDQEEFLLTEYFVYRLYHLFTSASFGVRRVEMTYRDTGSGEVYYQGPAFLIEDVDELAERLQGEEYHPEGKTVAGLDSLQTGIMSVFQFMIGNLDWNVEREHNIKLIRVPAEGQAKRLLPVPYDFDLSGLVDAVYSDTPPDPDIPEMPFQRIYRGPCFSPALLEAILDVFREQEDKALQLIRSKELLRLEKRQEIESLLTSFYQVINSPAQVDTYFIRYCQD